jgi:hypothetical protein
MNMELFINIVENLSKFVLQHLKFWCPNFEYSFQIKVMNAFILIFIYITTTVDKFIPSPYRILNYSSGCNIINKASLFSTLQYRHVKFVARGMHASLSDIPRGPTYFSKYTRFANLNATILIFKCISNSYMCTAV